MNRKKGFGGAPNRKDSKTSFAIVRQIRRSTSARFTWSRLAMLYKEGMRRIVNAGKMTISYPEVKKGNVKDVEAIRSDWDAVGRDIRVSIGRI